MIKHTLSFYIANKIENAICEDVERIRFAMNKIGGNL